MKTGLIIIIFLFCSNSHARETFWEMGAGITALNTPHYPGSSENKNFVIPLPYFRFQSEHFEVDDSVRGYLFESPDLRLNISGGLGVPVNSKDSTVRDGMPDLDTVLQVGPSLEFIFSGGRRQPHEFRLELPVRAAIATDLTSADYAGWIAEPRFTYETLRPFKSGWAYRVRAGFHYASEDYHAYYYDVPAEFATPQRAEYHAQAGYTGAFVDFTGNWRQKDLIYFAYIRYENLNGVAYEDSPLVEETNYVAVGIGLLWIFADSQK